MYFRTEIQYPRRMEVLTTAGETITPDKWYPETLNLRQAVRLKTPAHLYPFSFRPIDIFFMEAPFVEKWWPAWTMERQAVRKKPLAHLYPFVEMRENDITPQEDVAQYMTKWYYSQIFEGQATRFKVSPVHYPFSWIERCPDSHRRQAKNSTSHTYPSENSTSHTYPSRNSTTHTYPVKQSC